MSDEPVDRLSLIERWEALTAEMDAAANLDERGRGPRVTAQVAGRWAVEVRALADDHQGAVAALERLANPTHRPRSEEAALLQAEVVQIAQATLDALGGQ
jgi:hypothetical protein